MSPATLLSVHQSHVSSGSSSSIHRHLCSRPGDLRPSSSLSCSLSLHDNISVSPQPGYVTTAGHLDSVTALLPTLPATDLPPSIDHLQNRSNRPIWITTRPLVNRQDSASCNTQGQDHSVESDHDSINYLTMTHDGKEFRTSFGRGGAGNLRRVSEAQHAHSMLLQMRRNSADIDASAAPTPQQGRRKSSSVSTSFSNVSSFLETFKRRVSSASSLSSLTHISSRKHQEEIAPEAAGEPLSQSHHTRDSVTEDEGIHLAHQQTSSTSASSPE